MRRPAKPLSLPPGDWVDFALDIPPNGMMGLEADRGQMEYRRIRIKEVSR